MMAPGQIPRSDAIRLRTARVLLSLLLTLLAGCQTALREDAVPPTQALASPYALRLAVAPETARPGEQVAVAVEFTNTGRGPLWVPRQREVFLGYRSASIRADSWSSSCDGIRYVRLRPGQKVRYELPFAAPLVEGQIEIYVTVRQDITVPLNVTRAAVPAG